MAGGSGATVGHSRAEQWGIEIDLGTEKNSRAQRETVGEAVGNREDSGSQMLWLAGAPTPMGPRGPWRPAVFLHIASMSTVLVPWPCAPQSFHLCPMMPIHPCPEPRHAPQGPLSPPLPAALVLMEAGVMDHHLHLSSLGTGPLNFGVGVHGSLLRVFPRVLESGLSSTHMNLCGSWVPGSTLVPICGSGNLLKPSRVSH